MALPVTRLVVRTHADITQVDQSIIKSTLSHSPGVGAVEVDADQNLVAIVTASQDGGAEVLKRLADHGYPHDVVSEESHSTERNLDPVP